MTSEEKAERKAARKRRRQFHADLMFAAERRARPATVGDVEDMAADIIRRIQAETVMTDAHCPEESPDR